MIVLASCERLLKMSCCPPSFCVSPPNICDCFPDFLVDAPGKLCEVRHAPLLSDRNRVDVELLGSGCTPVATRPVPRFPDAVAVQMNFSYLHAPRESTSCWPCQAVGDVRPRGTMPNIFCCRRVRLLRPSTQRLHRGCASETGRWFSGGLCGASGNGIHLGRARD